MKWGAPRHQARVPVGVDVDVERPATALSASEFGTFGSSALVGNGPPPSGADSSLRGNSTYGEPQDVLGSEEPS
jgi:hypothetical protein